MLYSDGKRRGPLRSIVRGLNVPPWAAPVGCMTESVIAPRSKCPGLIVSNAERSTAFCAFGTPSDCSSSGRRLSGLIAEISGRRELRLSRGEAGCRKSNEIEIAVWPVRPLSGFLKFLGDSRDFPIYGV